MSMLLQIVIAATFAALVMFALWPTAERRAKVDDLVSLKPVPGRVQQKIIVPDFSTGFVDEIDIVEWLKQNKYTVDGPPDLLNHQSERINGSIVSLSHVPIFRTVNTVSFSVFERLDISVHYMAEDVLEERRAHPCIRELYFLSLFRGLGVAPAPIGVSGSMVDYKPSLKTSFARSIPSASKIGYIVMENHDVTLLQYFRDFIADFLTPSYGFRNSIVLGIELLRSLNTVHSRQIVHGSVSMSSAVLMETPGSPVRLINWRRAYRVTGQQPVRVQTRLDSPQTVWEIEGYRSSFRDDVFRVFMIMSILINGLNSWKNLSFDELKHGEIFCPNGCYVHLRSTNLYNRLHSIVKRYVTVPARAEVDVHIDIIGIIDELENILKGEYL